MNWKHTSLKTFGHIENLDLTVLLHPPFIGDLWPPYFYLFESKKDGHHIPSNGIVIAAVKQWLTGADFYKRGMHAHDYRWRQCIGKGADYVEK